MVLNQDAAEDFMESSSLVAVNSCLRKRKAEFDPEEEEESGGETEEESDGKAKIEAEIEQREAGIRVLMAPEWDVDSFDGLEYYSSSELDIPSDEKPYSDDEESREKYRISKRQIIESKGFKVDPEVRPNHRFRGICPTSLELPDSKGGTYADYCEEMVHICLRKHKEDNKSKKNVEFVELVRAYYRGGPRPKSYITFMAREKPDGPLVEYQAKAMATVDGKKHPILCRPAPTLKP